MLQTGSKFAMDWTRHIFFLVSLTTNVILVRGYAGCSSAYGSTPCSFVPAPPGKTPPCARPGLTFCEHPDHYPGQLITYLVQKWQFDHSTLIASESREEFSSYFQPAPSPVYGPPNYQNYGPPSYQSYGHHGSVHNSQNHPEPIYINKPQIPFQDSASYNAPLKAYLPQNFTEEGGRRYNFRFTNSLPAFGQQYQPQSYYAPVDPQNTPYNNHIWKRRIESHYQRLRRSLKHQRKLQRIAEEGQSSNSTTLSRTKRQAVSSETLCRVRSQYIAPKAALNNKGNWMYVVNMPEVDSSYTQLVKSEICVSQTCSGICSLPDGYTSRCEQKYAQKKLVALEAGGNQLYNDLFWFPSCCVCTLSRN